MGVLSESCSCFCNGGGGANPEKLKAALFSGKGPATARISGVRGGMSGTGFLIHRNLLLTTNSNVPSVAAAEAAEVWMQGGFRASSLFPHRFFISSSVLDLTIVEIDPMNGDSNTHYLKTCSKPNLELGNLVYLLGYTDMNELAVGEGTVVIATDNLIKLSTNGGTLSSGSVGFDAQGSVAFMVCDPMKLATSPKTKSSSTSLKRDHSMQFGIPIPIICDWLIQHWEGNLAELNKPKLSLIGLVSSGQRSENSCASLTMRKVFKSAQPREEWTLLTFSNPISETNDATITRTTHIQGIQTPEIYESRKLISVPLRKKDASLIQLLDINFPPKLAKQPVLSESIKKIARLTDKNHGMEALTSQPLLRKEDERKVGTDVASIGSVSGPCNEVQFSSSPIGILEEQIEYSSEGETTMYSAETAESRNNPSPKEGKLQQAGRSRSCVNYNRGEAVQRYPLARKAVLAKQRSFMQGRKVHSQGDGCQRTNNDYYTPTFSSKMKKKLNSVQPIRPRPSVVHSSSPRWMF